MKKRSDKNALQESGSLLLLIDTSTTICVCGLARGSNLIAETTLASKNGHSRHLAGMVDHLLSLFDYSFQDLDAIALSAGPGSFTGLRIGYSYAKGIAHTTRLPLIEIPTLELWASTCLQSKRLIMPVVDARRGDIYTALYMTNGSEIKEVQAPQILPIDNISEFTSEALSVVGVGEHLREELSAQLPPDSEILPSPLPVPHPAILAKLASEAFNKQLFSDSSDCEPRYMRPFQGIM